MERREGGREKEREGGRKEEKEKKKERHDQERKMRSWFQPDTINLRVPIQEP